MWGHCDFRPPPQLAEQCAPGKVASSRVMLATRTILDAPVTIACFSSCCVATCWMVASASTSGAQPTANASSGTSTFIRGDIISIAICNNHCGAAQQISDTTAHDCATDMRARRSSSLQRGKPRGKGVWTAEPNAVYQDRCRGIEQRGGMGTVHSAGCLDPTRDSDTGQLRLIKVRRCHTPSPPNSRVRLCRLAVALVLRCLPRLDAYT